MTSFKLESTITSQQSSAKNDLPRSLRYFRARNSSKSVLLFIIFYWLRDDFMNNSCADHDNMPRKFWGIRKYFAQRLDNKTRILDVGGICSYYDILKMIFPRGEIALLNINPDYVKGVDNAIVSNATKLPFKNETWNVITSFDLIEHLINPDDFLAEVFRVLKSGGFFIISTPNLADLYSRISFLFGNTPFFYNPSKFRVATPFCKLNTNMGHKSVFTHKALKQLLSLREFKIIQSEGYCYCDPFYFNVYPGKKKREAGFYGLRKTLDKILPKTMREGMLFICRKVRK